MYCIGAPFFHLHILHLQSGIDTFYWPISSYFSFESIVPVYVSVSISVWYASVAFISNLFHFFIVLFSAHLFSTLTHEHIHSFSSSHQPQYIFNDLQIVFILGSKLSVICFTCALRSYAWYKLNNVTTVCVCVRVCTTTSILSEGSWIKYESVVFYTCTLYTGKCNKSNIDSDSNLLAWTANHLHTTNEPSSEEVSYSFYFVPPKRKLIEGRKVFINMYKLALFTRNKQTTKIASTHTHCI